jgi:ribosomal protein S18 acetylase RimI-like enzyme
MVSAATSVEFRLAVPTDVDTVIAMMRALEVDDPNKKPFHEEKRRAAYGQLMRESRLGRIWLITADQKMVGYSVIAYSFSFEYAGRNAFLDELYVAPEYRGRGIGRKAIAFIEELARSEKLTALHLEVSRSNSRALHLYVACGFRDHERYLMTKWLDSADCE